MRKISFINSRNGHKFMTNGKLASGVRERIMGDWVVNEAFTKRSEDLKNDPYAKQYDDSENHSFAVNV